MLWHSSLSLRVDKRGCVCVCAQNIIRIHETEKYLSFMRVEINDEISVDKQYALFHFTAWISLRHSFDSWFDLITVCVFVSIHYLQALYVINLKLFGIYRSFACAYMCLCVSVGVCVEWRRIVHNQQEVKVRIFSVFFFFLVFWYVTSRKIYGLPSTGIRKNFVFRSKKRTNEIITTL